jgi:predicted ArsR family transcriptional regulator
MCFRIGGVDTTAIASVASLADPVRRALYDAVVASPTALSREQAAAVAGVPRGTAAFHLDKLVAEGLLDVEYRRLTGRTGPGAGRPAKLYHRSPHEVSVSVPPRRYDLAGGILAAAVEDALATKAPIRTAVARRARAFGEELARRVRSRLKPRASRATTRRTMNDVLAEHGFEPRQEGRRTLLGNCPFHALSADHTELVCGMNLELMDGLASGVDAGVRARLNPSAGRCCVVLEPAPR